MLCDKNLTYKFGKEQRYIFCNLCVELTCFLFSENEKMLRTVTVMAYMYSGCQKYESS